MDHNVPKEFRTTENESQDRKKLEPVVSNAIVKKKSGLRKFGSDIVSEDISNVGTYILTDVLIPSIKKTLLEIIEGGARMALMGDSKPSYRSNETTSYSRMWNGSNSRSGNTRYASVDRDRAGGYSFDDIILPSRADAEQILDELNDVIRRYGAVSVADLYDLIGQSCNYTDNNYGWTSLSNATVASVREGFMLKLPRAVPLK